MNQIYQEENPRNKWLMIFKFDFMHYSVNHDESHGDCFCPTQDVNNNPFGQRLPQFYITLEFI